MRLTSEKIGGKIQEKKNKGGQTMKVSKKYLVPHLIYFAVFIGGFAAAVLASYIVPIVYDYLVYLFPKVFHSYSPVSEPDEYARFMKWSAVTTYVLALVIINYIAMRLDNSRFEYFISKTEGFYKIPSAMKMYYREFLVSDIIVSVLIPPALTVPAYFMPKKAMDMILRFPFWSGELLLSYLSFTETIVWCILISLIARLILVPVILKKWRASWLTTAVG